MTVTINEAEARLRLALAAKADAVTDRESAEDSVPWPDASVIRLHPAPGPVPRGRRRWAIIAAAAAVALVVGSAVAITLHSRATNSSPATPDPHKIPWSQVGPDWALVVTAPPTSAAATAVHTLLLASPTGVNYPITNRVGDLSIYAGTWNHRTEQVLATTPAGLVLIDLHTGHQTVLSIQGVDSGAVAAIGPSFLVAQNKRLSVINDTGRVLRQFDGASARGFLVSEDGSQVAVGTTSGLVLYDAGSGQITTRWSPLPGTSTCSPQAWLPAESVIEGVCDVNGNSGKSLGAYFSISTGATTARTLPGGWGTVRLAGGTVAYREPGATAEPTVPLNKAVQFAQADSAGRLSPLTKPTQFDQGFWQIYYVLPAGFLVFSNNPSNRLVLWNPLSGRLSSYLGSGVGNDLVTGFDIWS